MKIQEVIGRSLDAVWCYPEDHINSAWNNEPAFDVYSSFARLQFSDGGFAEIITVEVDLVDEKYPALGLELCEVSDVAELERWPSGPILKSKVIKRLKELLPNKVKSIETSDPLEEGAVSQFKLHLTDGSSITFQHIMPPMTLGIAITKK